MEPLVELLRRHLQSEKRASPHTVRAYLADLEALLEVEILEARTTAAQVSATLRQEIEPPGIERGFGSGRSSHASSYTVQTFERFDVSTFSPVPAGVECSG